MGFALSWREFLVASALAGTAVWLAPHQLFAEDVGIVNLARSSAAMMCKEVTEIPGYGWFSVILDPSGAALALWQMKTTAATSVTQYAEIDRDRRIRVSHLDGLLPKAFFYAK